MIAGAIEEDLSLVLESTESLRVNDARAISLVGEPVWMPRFGVLATSGVGGFLGERSETFALESLELSSGDHPALVPVPCERDRAVPSSQRSES